MRQYDYAPNPSPSISSRGNKITEGAGHAYPPLLVMLVGMWTQPRARAPCHAPHPYMVLVIGCSVLNGTRDGCLFTTNYQAFKKLSNLSVKGSVEVTHRFVNLWN